MGVCVFFPVLLLVWTVSIAVLLFLDPSPLWGDHSSRFPSGTLSPWTSILSQPRCIMIVKPANRLLKVLFSHKSCCFWFVLYECDAMKHLWEQLIQLASAEWTELQQNSLLTGRWSLWLEIHELFNVKHLIPESPLLTPANQRKPSWSLIP